VSHIRTRTLSSGQKRYQAKLTDPSGREHVKTFSKLTDARMWLRDRESSMLRADLYSSEPSQVGLTFQELATAWQGTWHRIQPKTEQRYSEYLNLWLLPYFRDTPVALITHQRVQEFVDAMAAGQLRRLKVGLGTKTRPPAPSTVRGARAALSAMLTEGVRVGALQANPTRHIRLPRAEKKQPVILTLDELDHLASVFGPTDALAVRLTFSSGLRAGELWGLQVRDLRGNVLRVERAAKLIKGKLVLGPTKTHATRDVTLPPAFAATLHAHASRQSGPLSPLFVGPEGAPVRHNLWTSRVWRKGVRAAFPAPTYPATHRKLRFHDLRHTHASLLLANGHPATAVAKRLGHASVTTTLSIYAHALPNSDAELAAFFA